MKRDILKKFFSKKKRRDCKGFTLVELIVSVAVMSVVVLMIFSMMVSSSTFYSKTNTSMAVTYSLQETMSQIKETVIDCSEAIKVDASFDSFVVINKRKNESEANKYEYMGCVYKYVPGADDSVPGTLYYGETQWYESPKSLEADVDSVCNVELAKNVNSFKVTRIELTDYKDKEYETLHRIKGMSFEITIVKNGRSDSAVETVAPRNLPLQVTSYGYKEDAV